jgi:hypothetical protein
MIPLHPAIFEAGNTGWIQMMEIDQVAALCTELDFPLLLTQSNPPARKSLPSFWIAPGKSCLLEMTGKCDREIAAGE